MGGCGGRIPLRMAKLRSRAWVEGIQEKEEEGKKSIQEWQQERSRRITDSDPYMKCVSPLLSPLCPFPNRCMNSGTMLVFYAPHTYHHHQHQHLYSCWFQIAKWNRNKWSPMRMYPLELGYPPSVDLHIGFICGFLWWVSIFCRERGFFDDRW